MGTVQARTPGALVACILAAAALTTSPAAALEGKAAAAKILFAGPSGPLTFVQPEAPLAGPRPQAASFQVTYRGFSAAARAAFQRAVDLWAQRVNSPVAITVSASFEPLGTGVLGSAGSSFVWRNFAGAQRPNTWYVDALANKLARRQIHPAPDIVARFSSAFPNWHFGTGPAPSNRYDFTAVVLHELGHGLGFLGAGQVSGSLGTVRLAGSPVVYDHFAENGAGLSLLNRFPDNSTALGTQLRGNNLFFDSARVRAANQNRRARIYAPSVFRSGSSYSHLDEATYARGNPNSLMTPILGQGETIRSPGPITLAIFGTLGW